MTTQLILSHFHHLGWKHQLIMLSVKSAVLATKLTALGNGGFFQLALRFAKLAHALMGANTH